MRAHLLRRGAAARGAAGAARVRAPGWLREGGASRERRRGHGCLRRVRFCEAVKVSSEVLFLGNSEVSSSAQQRGAATSKRF